MEKLNIAELLKNCPKGMELDCTMFDNVTLDSVDNEKDTLFPIKVLRQDGCGITLTKYGQYAHAKYAKCVIYPKGKTTWEGFIPPFKDGDIIYNQGIKATAIFYKQTNDNTISHCFLNIFKELKIHCYHSKSLSDWRLATEEEKEKLFKAIKDNGYRWNPETKTLEKLIEPKFKVGDVIQDEDAYKVTITEINVEDECYEYESMIAKGIGGIAFSEQDNWKLVPNKFDITTLVPFESRVLVRDGKSEKWYPATWGLKTDDIHYPYVVIGGNSYNFCIPFECNEYLLGKNIDCKEFYKTWE